MRFRAIRVSGIALACVVAAASVAQAQSTLYTSKPAFVEALATTPTEIGFDNLPSGAPLAGNAFQHLGVTIENVDGHPIHVASWTASGNLEIPTRPNAISSTYASRPEPGFSAACCGVYFNNAASDHIRMVFATPVTAAGIHVGENDFRGVTLTWYGIDGAVIRTHTAGAFNPGNGFVGLVSQNTPIAALVVYNAANDGDGMFFDDLVFEHAPSPRAGALAAYVVNNGSNTVSIIDAITHTVSATIVVGLAPAAIVPTPDGRFLYVTNSGDNTVSVIDAATHVVVTSIAVGPAPAPLVISADGATVYVANTGANSISVIDTATNTVTATIDVGASTFDPVFPNGPAGPPYSYLAITPDGSRVYVTNTFPFNQPYSSSLKVVDTATKTVVAGVQLSQRNSGSVALTGDGSIGYVTGWFGYFQVFNVLTNTQVDAFTLSGGGSGISLAGIAIPASGPLVYVAASEHNSVYAINPLTRSGTRVPVGLYPTDVSIAPDGSVAYVTNRADATVSVIELATNAVVATIGVGRYPSKVAFITPTAATPAVSWEPGPLAYRQPVGAGQLNALSSVAGTFTYSVAVGTLLAPGAHSVTARFTPDDRERYQEVVATATITVAENHPPTLVVGGPYAAYAETLLHLNAAASDPDGHDVSVQWDLDGDGIFETSGQHATLIVPANSSNVAVRAVDQWGALASAMVSVLVIAADSEPSPLPGPIDPYFAPRPSFIDWHAATEGLRANYGPRFDAVELPTTCAVASQMLSRFPLWRIHRTGFLGLTVEIRPNYPMFVAMVRALPPAYKYVAIGFAVKCNSLPIPGGAALASQIGLSLDCPQLRELYKDLVGEWPEETLANALPIPDRLREIIRTRLVLCPFKLDLSGYGCQEKIEIAGELAELLLPGLGSLLNSPVGKFLANALLCDGVEIPDLSFEFPDVDWGFGDPGCWFGCGSGGDGGGDGGGGSGGSGGSGDGSGDFHWERLPSFGEGDWDWATLPPSPPTGPGNYVDCALLPADWQTMNWGQLVHHGALLGASPMTMLDVLAACTRTKPVDGLPFRSDVSVSLVGPSSALVGEIVVYDLAVRTAGPGGAPLSRVMVTAATAFEVVPADGPCRALSPNSARCDFGTVAVGTERSIPLSLRFASDGPVQIRAGVVSYVADSNLTDNVTRLDVIVEKRIPSVDWAPATLVYGAPIGAAQLNAFAAVGGSFSYSLAPGTRLPAGTHPASVVFTPDDQARYATVTKSAEIDVDQALLTVAVNDASREFGAANPAFTVGYAGLVNGDSPAVLDGMLAFSTAATPSSPVGPYTVSASGLTSTNYAITYTSGTLRVIDTTPPDIDSVVPDIRVLWAPNHRMVGVTLQVSATDVASVFACTTTNVSSNEPVNGTGDGDIGPDWDITGSHTVNLRAERAGSGSGRVYNIQVECRDTYGNASTASTTVSVPHDRR